MGDLIWKLKQLFRKIFPIALIGAFLYGGFNLYKAGAFRRSFGSTVSSMLRHVPYFGTRFKEYIPSSSRRSYSYQGKRSRGRHVRRHGRRHSRRR